MTAADETPTTTPTGQVALTGRAAIYRHEPAPTPGERFTVTVTSRLSIAIDPRAARIGDFPVASDDRELTIEWTDEDTYEYRTGVVPLGPGMIRALRGALDAAERDAAERGGQPDKPGLQAVALDDDPDYDDF